MDKYNIFDGLDSVVWYNGLGDFVIKWADIEPNEYGQITSDQAYRQYQNSQSLYYQLQVLWIICVTMFGDYGTSPRCGWIEDVVSFRQFIKFICKTYLDDRDMTTVNNDAFNTAKEWLEKHPDIRIMHTHELPLPKGIFMYRYRKELGGTIPNQYVIAPELTDEDYDEIDKDAIKFLNLLYSELVKLEENNLDHHVEVYL